MRVGLEKMIFASLCVALALSCLWVFIGLRFNLWTPADYTRYRWLCAHIKIAPEFWHGRIKAGEDAHPIVKTWPPQILHQFGPWAELDWAAINSDKNHSHQEIEIQAIAKNARFVSARSYADDGVATTTFFDIMTPAEHIQYQSNLLAYVQGKFTQKPHPVRVTRTPVGRPHPH
jgi:hypothetical protein